jgi:alkaline phosphatase
MKLRNQILAFFCLLTFAAVGWLYVRSWVVQKPFGIVLFVSDGLITSHLTSARLYEKGADHRLFLESFPHLALLRNPARDYAVPDDAAAATAFATGTKGSHRSVGLDSQGKLLTSILDLAKQKGRAVGLITTSQLTAPSAAAFYAHSPNTQNRQPIADQLLANPSLNLIFGGGRKDFLPEISGGQRQDGRNLLAEFQAKGWELIQTKSELAKAPNYRTSGIIGFFAKEDLAFTNQTEVANEQPALADLVRRAIEFLQVRREGYLLIVDATLVTTAAEQNHGEQVLLETLALDRAIRAASEYAGGKSLILAAGKHATGGLSLNGYPLVTDHGAGLLGINSSGQPTLTWATGPNGPTPTASPKSNPTPEPAAFFTPSAFYTAEDVIAIGTGDGSEKLHGFLENTEIFEIIRQAL